MTSVAVLQITYFQIDVVRGGGEESTVNEVHASPA